MSGEAQSKQEALAARYNLPTQPEWQQFLNHFDLSEMFALVVLLVADADGAELCRVELEKQLQQEGKKLISLDVASPDALRKIPSQLLNTQLPADAGGIWVAGVEPDYSPNFSAWKEAWRYVMHRLNPRRNEIRRQFNCSLIFVGAPWLQETMREIAPDIWSVRTLVARIEPQAASETKAISSERPTHDLSEPKSGGDPLFALQEAEKLRGIPGKELALARLLHRAGEGFASRSDWRSAEKAYAEALQLKQQVGGSPDSLLATLNKLSWTCHVLGQARRSLDYAQSALTIARQTGNRIEEEKALNNLGLAHAALGDVRKALEFHEQQLAIAREIGNRRGEGSSLNNLGIAYAGLGEERKAIKFYEQALVIHHETGNRNGEGNALMNLGIAHFKLGDARKAIEYHEQALSVFRDIGDRRGESNALGNLGITYSALGDKRKAIEFYEQTQPVFREIGDQRGESYTLCNLGVAYSALGDAHKAIEFYEQALIIGREIGDQYGEANALFNSAVARDSLGNRADAIIRAEAALKIYKAIEHPNAAKVRVELAKWRKQV
jgi:tetratricopeptide (TPR) repeat protein